MSHKYTTVAALLFGTAVLPHLASAQEGERLLQKELAADGQPSLIKFKAASRPSAADGAFVLRQQLGLGQNEQMRPAHVDTDELGFTHQKFEQFYQGIKVEHATYTVHARQGAVESLSGDYEKVDQLSTTPTLSASAALRRALAAVGATKYMWQDAAEEASLRQQSGNPTASYQPRGELVIVRDFRKGAETGPLVLAWKFDIYAQAPVSRAYYYVSAQTGDVVLRDDIIKHTTHATTVAATGSFATAYSGTRSVATETTSGGYRLREYTRGNGIETYNCKKGTSYTAAVDFVDADNNWTAAEYNNANFDNAAGDAHFGAQATYDYWKATHNRNSYNNAGAKILSYVHYGNRYENAFWDGSRMTYGDGASTFKPLTSLDVCGHEIGHAVCSSTANLTYSYESGALNEGFSDIWGACVEKYTVDKFALGNKSTWDIGEEIMRSGGALRSMSNPNLYNQPAYYKGLKWYTGSGDNGGVHYNSGVLNYWFYLISAGKTGTNEKGAAYSVASLGITNAARIAYRAESVYLTASSNYAAARTATIQAATDLFGAGSAQVTAVTNAWNAVGVGGATPSGYCTSKGTSQVYEWIDYVAIGSIARTSGVDNGYYDGTASTTSVTANTSQIISYSAAFKSTAYTEYFKIYADWNQDGDFSDSGETIVSSVGSSVATTRSSSFTVPSTARNGKTRLRVVMSYNSTTTACETYGYGETEDYSITVTGGVNTSTLDGGVAGLTGTTAVLDAAAELSLYPNPATDALHLSLSSGTELKSVDVLDTRGAKASVRYLGNGEVSLSGLAPGLYVLRASDGQNTFTKRFAKQ